MGNACCCNDGYAYKQRRQELLERRPPPPTEWPSGEVNLFRLGAAGHPCIEERYDFRRDRVGQSLGLGIVRRVFSWNADDGGAAYWCKTIPLSDLEPPELVENVRVEMFMMATLPRHPALPRLREVYKDDAAVHLVMDCDDAAAGGATLLSDSGVMPEVEAARVGRAVVDVLRVLHEAGVVLRDVKPANFILLSGQQLQVMLLDFCCATRFISGPGGNYETCIFTGAMDPNTNPYMAPEVVDGGRYGPKADVWSAGVIIYQLLYGGRHPLPPPGVGESSGGETYDMQMAGLGSSAAGSHGHRRSSHRRHVSAEGANDLIRRMLEPNPSKRPTALQVLEHPWLVHGGGSGAGDDHRA